MTRRYARLAVLVAVVAAPLWRAAADETLASAYKAILRGDYDTGRAAVDRIVEENGDPGAKRA